MGRMERDLSRRKERRSLMLVYVCAVDVCCACVCVYVCGRLRETIDKYVTVGVERDSSETLVMEFRIQNQNAVLVLRLCVRAVTRRKCGWIDGVV